MVNKTDTQIPQLIINKLTKEQYEQALAQGLISETELYAVTDEDDYVTVNAFNNIIANYTTTENLANVALSGEYSDLLNKPELANVALSGDYADLTNTPSIPDPQVQTDWNATSGMGVILNKPHLMSVATTGEYSDLLNTPNIDQTYNASSANAQSGVAVASAISDMQVVSNMVDTISNTSTNTTYPTTSAVYNSIANLSGVVFREWE